MGERMGGRMRACTMLLISTSLAPNTRLLLVLLLLLLWLLFIIIIISSSSSMPIWAKAMIYFLSGITLSCCASIVARTMKLVCLLLLLLLLIMIIMIMIMLMTNHTNRMFTLIGLNGMSLLRHCNHEMVGLHCIIAAYLGFWQRFLSAPQGRSCHSCFWVRTCCHSLPHVAIVCRMLPTFSHEHWFRGKCGTSATTPFVLTLSGSCPESALAKRVLSPTGT